MLISTATMTLPKKDLFNSGLNVDKQLLCGTVFRVVRQAASIGTAVKLELLGHLHLVVVVQEVDAVVAAVGDEEVGRVESKEALLVPPDADLLGDVANL